MFLPMHCKPYLALSWALKPFQNELKHSLVSEPLIASAFDTQVLHAWSQISREAHREAHLAWTGFLDDASAVVINNVRVVIIVVDVGVAVVVLLRVPLVLGIVVVVLVINRDINSSSNSNYSSSSKSDSSRKNSSTCCWILLFLKAVSHGGAVHAYRLALIRLHMTWMHGFLRACVLVCCSARSI